MFRYFIKSFYSVNNKDNILKIKQNLKNIKNCVSNTSKPSYNSDIMDFLIHNEWKFEEDKDTDLPIISKIKGNTKIIISLQESAYKEEDNNEDLKELKSYGSKLDKQLDDVDSNDKKQKSESLSHYYDDSIEKKSVEYLTSFDNIENFISISKFTIKIIYDNNVHYFDCISKENDLIINNYITIDKEDNINDLVVNDLYQGPQFDTLDYYLQISVYEFLRVFGIDEPLVNILETINYNYHCNKTSKFENKLNKFINEQLKLIN